MLTMTAEQLCFGILIACFIVNISTAILDMKRLERCSKAMKILEIRIETLERERT